jgi:tetratricopeptide (TPR) repeat protein
VSRRGALAAVSALLAAALAARVAYAIAGPGSDPTFTRPALDGAYYASWARGLAAGTGSPGGAFYLAPLYPHALAAFFAGFGERWVLLAIAQGAAGIAAALLLAALSRKHAGELAGLCTAALALAYHPLMFFGARPLGEALAIPLLALAVFLADRDGRAGAWGATGVVGGIAALARPNLLLVPAALLVPLVRRRAWIPAAALAAGTLAAVLPVAVRNLAVSGHLVPISANDGITLYHGNGPGALGVFTPPEGFSGDPLRQRDEATSRASALSGRRLDAVEADRFFRREAVRVRLADPAGTAALAGYRVLLLLDDFEHGLDYAPFLDTNPFRWSAPVPFALLAGLACAGLVALGARTSGGAAVWTAIAAAALVPVVFYVSSRYRLPFSVLLAVPAGAGASVLAGTVAAASPARRWGGLLAGLACALLSLCVPSGRLVRSETAGALANRGVAFQKQGDLAAAERDLRAALAIDASASAVWYNLAVVLEASGRGAEAERAYVEALSREPGHAESSGNLAALLLRRGDAEAAIPVLRRALASRPGSEVLWTNLVVALASAGRAEEARRAARDAAGAGVTLDPELLAAVGGASP